MLLNVVLNLNKMLHLVCYFMVLFSVFLLATHEGTAYILPQYFFLDNRSQLSLNTLPQNLHTSLVWGQALKANFINFPIKKNWLGKKLKF